MKILNILWLCWVLLACQSKKSTSAKVADPVSAEKPTRLPVDADAGTLDLIRLKNEGTFAQTQSVTVVNDPVYHARKVYRAVPLLAVLKKIPGYAEANPAHTQVVFECGDGYNPSMPLTKVLGRRAFLAVRDTDAPAGQDWIKVGKAGQTKDVAPFYVVYTDVPATDESYKWPYNLVRIRLVSAEKELAVLLPPGAPANGYDLFRVHCLSCHALNGVGGQMGPELNFPKNITEYWHEADLKAFVRNPASYRNGVKMPAIPASRVSDQELNEIVDYLKFMAGHKRRS
ncbi:MAG: cytochrome c [Cytophagaceae bacterium]|nr:cytochrome c [Cytophagaceae bacterium]